jgi:hypothetical protein
MLTQAAAIVAKNRGKFYFQQRLLQLVLQNISDGEMFHATLSQHHCKTSYREAAP